MKFKENLKGLLFMLGLVGVSCSDHRNNNIAQPQTQVYEVQTLIRESPNKPLDPIYSGIYFYDTKGGLSPKDFEYYLTKQKIEEIENSCDSGIYLDCSIKELQKKWETLRNFHPALPEERWKAMQEGVFRQKDLN